MMPDFSSLYELIDVRVSQILELIIGLCPVMHNAALIVRKDDRQTAFAMQWAFDPT